MTCSDKKWIYRKHVLYPPARCLYSEYFEKPVPLNRILLFPDAQATQAVGGIEDPLIDVLGR